MIAAERDGIARSQRGVRDADAVDEGAVGGFEVANPPAAFLADDLGVVSARLRLLAVREDDVVVPAPTDPHPRPAEDRVLSPARSGQESESKPGQSRRPLGLLLDGVLDLRRAREGDNREAL